jgi:hypothetical protein
MEVNPRPLDPLTLALRFGEVRREARPAYESISELEPDEQPDDQQWAKDGDGVLGDWC